MRITLGNVSGAGSSFFEPISLSRGSEKSGGRQAPVGGRRKQGWGPQNFDGASKTLFVPNIEASFRHCRDGASCLCSIVMPTVIVTRRVRFNAAHRVFNPELSDAENERLFGKCNNPNWHGHNYILDVSVEGPIDQKTGYVLDLSELKKLVSREVIDLVDHRNFNLDVDFMKGMIPTSENIVVAFWKILEPGVLPAKLTKLVLWETENNYVEYTGR